jgi:hypothetical protein
LLLSVAGCGTNVASQPPSGDWPTAAARALAAWAAFPVDAESRPIVLIAAADSRVPFGVAYRTEAGHLPSGPARFDGYPVISAHQALDRLQAAAYPQIHTEGDTAATVTHVRLAGEKFQTDRGPMTLPTWVFTVSGASSAAQVPALARGARYMLPDDARAGGIPVQVTAEVPGTWPGETATDTEAGRNGVRISPDGRELTFSVLHQPDPGDEPCGQGPTDTRVELVESAHAVAYRTVFTELPRSRPPRPSKYGCAAPAVFGFKPVTLRLAAPLGNRVLVKVINPPVP